eukprot:TRINITY_DN26358_c0_g2_i1.p1 TRINITY_DN26358_c0_g2~~TRINITY_DN26358_c0_g2_i1.p1  ORF type:complete len:464 (-),score=37.37 TRINITY_DN26358_c0_g2_i1:6-1397(-)
MSSLSPLDEEYSFVGDTKPLPAIDVAYRFRHLFFVCAIGLLQGCLLASQVPFIKSTWFAQRYAEPGTVVDCDATPKLSACQRGSADMAYWDGLLSGISGFSAVVTALFLGALSDATGRRKVLVFKFFLGLCASLSFAAVMLFDLSLWTYLIMDALDRSFDAYGVLFAVVSDLTRDIQAQRGPILGSCMVVFVVMACVFMPCSALLSSKVAAVGAAALSALNLVLIAIILPETCPTAARKSFSINVVAFELSDSIAILNRHSFMRSMVAVLTVAGVAFAGKQMILRPYLMAQFGLDKKHMAILLPICTPSVALAFTFGIWKMVSTFGEVRTLQLSLVANALQTVLTICASHAWQVFGVYAVMMGPGLLFIPLINAIKSNLCSDQEQGKVQGVIAAVRGFAVSFSDIAFGALYEWTTEGGKHTENAKSALFVVLALTTLAACVSLTLPISYPKPALSEEEEVELM